MKAIMYHYIKPRDPSLPYLRYLHIDNFAKQLDFFKREYVFLTKEELKESVLSGKPKDKGIVLTFDDGLKDHFRYVLPQLEKRGLWGIFYISTYPYATGRIMDVHRIHMLIGKYGGRRIFKSIQQILTEDILSHAHIKAFRTKTYKEQDNDSYTDHVKRMLNYYIDYEYRERFIDKLMSIYYPEKKARASDFYMVEDEILKLHNAGMVIGSHTVSHPVMSKLTIKDQEKEIKLSFEFIESIIGHIDIKTFSYPYGGSYTFTGETEKLLAKNNCLFSFNVEAKDIDQNDLLARKQALPRYDCNQFPYGAYQNVKEFDPLHDGST